MEQSADNEQSIYHGEVLAGGRLPPVKAIHAVNDDAAQPVVTVIPSKKNKIGTAATSTTRSPTDDKIYNEDREVRVAGQNTPRVQLSACCSHYIWLKGKICFTRKKSY